MTPRPYETRQLRSAAHALADVLDDIDGAALTELNYEAVLQAKCDVDLAYFELQAAGLRFEDTQASGLVWMMEASNG